jgi:hypothetical protein
MKAPVLGTVLESNAKCTEITEGKNPKLRVLGAKRRWQKSAGSSRRKLGDR